MSASFELPSADRFTVGAIGPPGQRTFYLQARLGDQLVTLKLEKQQVGALAQLLGELLADLPTVDPVPPPLDLEEPALPEWAVGSVQLAYDGTIDRVVMLVEEIETVDENGNPLPAGGLARLAITRDQAATVADHGAELVSSGRPRCPLCGFPMDPSGHACPRTNGHGPPSR